MCIYYNILLYMWSPPPEPTSQSLLNVNAIYQCQCDTSMSLTSVKIPSKCQRHLPPMSMLHINVINIYQNSKTILWKAKRNNILKLFGEGPMEKTKKLEKTKKNNNILRLLAGLFTSPRPLEFFKVFSMCFCLCLFSRLFLVFNINNTSLWQHITFRK